MPQSLHVLGAHLVFSTKERRRWLVPDIQTRVWAYQSRILQNLDCHSITIGGVEDHRRESFQEELRRILGESGVTYDERYLWG